VKQIELSAGTIEYSDTGGHRPVLVLLHGLMMDASLWDGPMADLSADHRCVAPTLPLGAHRHAMRADADLSLPGSPGWSQNSWTASTCRTSPSSAMTPAGRSSSCSCAAVTHA
jgi:pimeloyl-ACP methyl ester carboxylesterase